VVDLSIEEAARELGHLRDELTAGSAMQTARILDHGEPVLAVVPWELYEALLATTQMPPDPRALMQAPPEVRDRALAAAAALAEAHYREDSALTDFKAFGEDDLHDATD
jgi:hypothetical protein